MPNIKHIPKNTGLSVDELNFLIEKGTKRHFKSGDAIVQIGQKFRFGIFILTGRAYVSRVDDEGNEFLLYYLEEGNACALSMICCNYYETSGVEIKAESDSTVLFVEHTTIQTLIQTHPTFLNYVFSNYSARFDELLELINQVVFKSLDERLVFYLKREMDTRNSNKIALTHEQIATHLNTSRVVISRLLKEMERQGEIILHRNLIEIINLKKI